MAYGIACVDDDAESLTIPDTAEHIAADFPTAPSTPSTRGNKSAARAAIVKYCNEHGLDLYTISEQYSITKGMSEEVLNAKLDLIKQDHGA